MKNYERKKEEPPTIFDLITIKSTEVKGVPFISGDRHFAEISKMKREDLPYPIYDFMSSGLTHNVVILEKNPYRMKGKRSFRRNFGMILLNWEESSVTLQSRKINGKVKFEHKIPFSELGW